MEKTFTIRVNGGELVETINITSWDEFLTKVTKYREHASTQSLQSFYEDNFQVKCPLSGGYLVCRVRNS